MANQITDGRTNVDTMEVASAPDNLAGSASGTNDTEIFYQGSSSWGYYTTTTRDGLLHDAGTAQNWANNTFYLLFNTGIAGLLEIRANGGVTVRFCGATVTDFFEVYVAGSDDYPPAFSGGWVQFVVDIETAYTAAVTNGDANTNTGGTPPATNAIRYVGVSTITSATMPRMADNTWLDQIARLPDGSAGIIIEGSNGGTTPWTWADVVTAATSTNKWATARNSDGGAIVLNTPVQFGINDATNHEFSDNNVTLLWDNQPYLADDIYGFEAVMGTGANFIRAGVKTGTGNDATGAQGWVIQAASDGARWGMDFSDANVDEVSMYGMSFAHGATFNLANVDIDMATVLFNDCNLAQVSNAKIVRANIVQPNTADGVAFMTTDDIGDIVNSTFEFSDGHAIEILTGGPASQSSIGNRFSGFGATGTNDAAIYNNSAAARTISISSPGLLSEHTYRNGTSATTTLSQDVAVTLTGMPDSTEIRVYDAATSDPQTELAGVENATDGTAGNRSFTFTLSAGTIVDVVVHNISYEHERFELTIPASASSIPINLRFDRNYFNP